MATAQVRPEGIEGKTEPIALRDRLESSEQLFAETGSYAGLACDLEL